jgi:hypothetical protein
MDQLERTQRNLATLRRTMGDLDALILPGDFDLQQAALFTLAQLMRNAYQLHMKELALIGPTPHPPHDKGVW